MKFNVLSILLALTLTSCASVNSYREPRAGSQPLAVVSGSSTRTGLAEWSHSSVTAIDGKPVGMLWSAESKINVVPGTHHFVITTEFNLGWGTGPYNSLTEVVASLKPGMQYRFVAKPSGASLSVWAEDAKGQRVSAAGTSKYQIESRNTVFITH